MNNATNIVKAVYAADNSSMFIVELVDGSRHWAWSQTVRDIAVGFQIGFGRFSAEVSKGFWNARKSSWSKVA